MKNGQYVQFLSLIHIWQCRVLLPGWYGFGSAITQWLDEENADIRQRKIALLQSMYKEWPFFESMLSNMDMVLAKADLAIAYRYSELVTDPNLRDSVDVYKRQP